MIHIRLAIGRPSRAHGALGSRAEIQARNENPGLFLVANRRYEIDIMGRCDSGIADLNSDFKGDRAVVFRELNWNSNFLHIFFRER